MTIAQLLVEQLNVLPPEKQQELLAFAQALVQEVQNEGTRPMKGAWRNHQAVGLWKDRTEMQDSAAWVRNLRRQQWERLSE